MFVITDLSIPFQQRVTFRVQMEKAISSKITCGQPYYITKRGKRDKKVMIRTILRDWTLDLTVDNVLRGQGADPAMIRERRPALVEVAEWAYKEGLPLLQPQVLALEMSVVGVRHERLLLEEGAWISGALLTQHLSGAEHVVLMACTIGKNLELIVSDLLHSDPVYGLALDGMGTAAMETLATQACNYYENLAAQHGWQVSIPLSPGMVGWQVDPGQRQIFNLLAPEEIGIRLTESAMMDPNKSLTQVVGMGTEIFTQGRTCDFCSLRDTCRYQDHYQPVQSA